MAFVTVEWGFGVGSCLLGAFLAAGESAERALDAVSLGLKRCGARTAFRRIFHHCSGLCEIKHNIVGVKPDSFAAVRHLFGYKLLGLLLQSLDFRIVGVFALDPFQFLVIQF